MEDQDVVSAQLKHCTEALLTAIATGDWEAYRELCAPDLTAFEPEACGHLVTGLPFHQFYFELIQQRIKGGAWKPPQNNISDLKVRVLPGGRAAVVTYVRLQQRFMSSDHPQTTATEETRVWQLSDAGKWVNCHFHRSPCPTAS